MAYTEAPLLSSQVLPSADLAKGWPTLVLTVVDQIDSLESGTGGVFRMSGLTGSKKVDRVRYGRPGRRPMTRKLMP